MQNSLYLNESTLIVCAFLIKDLMERFAVISYSPTAIQTIKWWIDVTQCGREISYSQRNRLACTRPWRRVTSRVLLPCRWGVLLFVLHFNSAPVILATWTRGEMSALSLPLFLSPSLFSLSFFVSCFLLFLFFSLTLPCCFILALFLSSACLAPSRSHRRWSFRTRGDTSRPWRTCSPRATSILTHPRCKSTNAFCASGTHAIQRGLLRWVL